MGRKHIALSALLILTGAHIVCAKQPSSQPLELDIAVNRLDRAISLWAEQTGYQVLLYMDDAPSGGATVPTIRGLYTPEEALKVLLASTNLNYELVNANTVAVGADIGSHPTSSTHPSPEGGSDSRDKMQQVVVTAQKRVERLQDVPVPVTALDSEALFDQNQLRIQDYYTMALGVSVVLDDYGAPSITIRGLSTGGGATPTTGIVVDDVPIGPASSLALAQQAPDLDPTDLARVEILRGPQGTLYGASSMGGLLKYVTVDPSTEATTGRLQIGTTTTRHSSDLGYNARAAINLPLSESLAVRASLFRRNDPGYIDNVQTGEHDVNNWDARGARLAARWQPSSDFSLTLNALYERGSTDGSASFDVKPTLGPLEQDRLRDTGTIDRKLYAYRATAEANLGGGQLTSVTGYNIRSLLESIDETFLLGPLSEMVFGVSGTPLINDAETKKFTQELRYTRPIGERFEWLLGLFYDHETTAFQQDLNAVDPTTGAIAGQWVNIDVPSTFSERAVFGAVTLHFTDRLDLQLGARESENRQTYTQTFTGIYDTLLLGLPSPIISPEVHSKDDSFTYLVTPRFRWSEDLMVYARLASGYRPGGPNIAITASGVGVLPSYDADSTLNYELGIKGNLFGSALSYDASVYYIDWKDIQLSVIDASTGFIYRVNANKAKSQGVELSLTARPFAHTELSGWVTWNDAELTDPFPPDSAVVGSEGDRLPFSSRFSGNISLDQQFPLSNGLTGTLGVSVSYVGDRKGAFRPVTLRQDYPAYAKTDARIRLRYETWTFNLFVNNLTDRRGLLHGGLGSNNEATFTYIQPRTVGVSLAKTF